MNELVDTRVQGPQEGLWLAHQMAQDKSLYNIAQLTSIKGPLCPERFVHAVALAFWACDTFHFRYLQPADKSLGSAQSIRFDASVLQALRTERVQGQGRSQQELEDQIYSPDLRTPTDLAKDLPFRSILVEQDPANYVWYLRSHHIAIDGMGLSLWQNKVWELYLELCQVDPQDLDAHPARLQPAPRSIADLAWRRYEASTRKALDARYWRHALRTRSKVQYASGPDACVDHPVSHPLNLPDELQARCAKYCLTHKVSENALWIALLGQSVLNNSNAREISIGIPFANRFGSPAASIPCMWMNLLPLRLANQPSRPLWERARQVQATLQSMSRHRLYRHEWMRQDMRRLQKHPELFGPVLNAITLPKAPTIPGLDLTTRRLSGGPVQDLTLTWTKAMDAEYPSLELELPTARASQRAFDNWSSALTDALEQSLRATKTKRASEVAKPIEDLLGLIESQVLAQSNQTAIESKFDKISYKELWDAAQQLAPRLSQIQGPVLLWLSRGPNAIIAMLACLIAKRAYAPMDVQGPIERNLEMIQALDPGIILREQPLPAQLAALEIPVQDLRAPIKLDPAAKVRSFPGEELAYWMHTSGSTGKPRAVAISRRALSNFVAQARKRYAWSPRDRVLQFAPLAFDASVEEIFVSLASGSTLVIRAADDTASIDAFIRAIRIRRISILDLPTAFWHEWVYAAQQDQDLGLPACLRQVIIGGEAVLPERVAQWRKLAPKEVELLNTYGPTEATVVVSAANLHQASTPVDSIGHGIEKDSLVLLSSSGQVVPEGEDAEIAVLSPSVCDGYADAPLQNHASFFLDARRSLTGYKTGDLGRFDPNGALIFLGRRDQEVKISGFRIHPSEVESALLAYPKVAQAAVLVERPSAGPAFLLAHVQAEATLDLQALRAHLAARLIAAAVPRTINVHAQLPKNSAGKIDRKALRAQSKAQRPTPTKLQGLPATVAQIWQELLQVPVQHEDCDFFDLGGESLHCLQLATRLSKALKTSIDANLFIAHPKLGDLCQAIESGEHQQDTGALEQLRAQMMSDLEAIQIPAAGTVAPKTPRKILLTGATGFLGAQLLEALATNQDLQVTCLARKLPEPKPRNTGAKVTWQQGDLALPKLGLSDKDFTALGASLDAVIHCAGTVSLMHDYLHCRETNVQGTKTLLDLLGIGPPKRFLSLSTLAVAPGAEELTLVPEAPIDWHPGLHNGYTQSKWVSEQAVIAAHAKGHWSCALRIGRAYAQQSNANDLLARVLDASAEQEQWPNLDVRESWVSSQEIATIVQAFLSAKERWPAVLNASDGLNYSWTELFALAAPHGTKLAPIQSWLDTLSRAGSPKSKALAALLEPLVSVSKKGSYLGLAPAQNLFLATQLSTLDTHQRYAQMLQIQNQTP